MQSQVRKESSSLRGWAGPGSNPDSGCTPLRASVGLSPNSPQAQSTVGCPHQEGHGLHSEVTGAQTLAGDWEATPWVSEGPGPGAVSGVTPGAERGARGPCPLRAPNPGRRSSPRVCLSEPWGQDSALCGDPTSWSICTLQMLNTSHHAQSNFSRPQALGELVSAWTPALSASCSFFLQQRHPTFLGGAAPPLHSAWVEVAPLPPASSWRALDPEPANQHSPSPATVMGSGVSTRPKSWDLIKVLGRGILSIAGCAGKWSHAGVSGGHCDAKMETGAVKLIQP